jgi:alanyl-tRNA synthetase
LNAGDLAKAAAKILGGGGGGRPNMAQAGGNNPDELPGALQSVLDAVRSKLQA